MPAAHAEAPSTDHSSCMCVYVHYIYIYILRGCSCSLHDGLMSAPSLASAYRARLAAMAARPSIAAEIPPLTSPVSTRPAQTKTSTKPGPLFGWRLSYRNPTFRIAPLLAGMPDLKTMAKPCAPGSSRTVKDQAPSSSSGPKRPHKRQGSGISKECILNYVVIPNMV